MEIPFLTAFSDGDPITAGSDRILQARIPGAEGQHHVTIVGGGHFLQEDKGPELAGVVVDFVATEPPGRAGRLRITFRFLPIRIAHSRPD